MTTLAKGTINLELEGFMPEETEKLRNHFLQLTQAQIHKMKNGKLILHFDNEGDIRKIEMEQVIFKS